MSRAHAFDESRCHALIESRCHARGRQLGEDILDINGNLYPGTVGFPYFTYYGNWVSPVPADNRFLLPMELTVPGTVPAIGDWSIVAGSLPPGLSLNDTNPSDNKCLISGTPSEAGTFNFTVRAVATGSNEFVNVGDYGDEEFQLFVGPLHTYDNLTFFSENRDEFDIEWGVGVSGTADGNLLWVPANFFLGGPISLYGATYGPVEAGSPKQWYIWLIPGANPQLHFKPEGPDTVWVKTGSALIGAYLNGGVTPDTINIS